MYRIDKFMMILSLHLQRLLFRAIFFFHFRKIRHCRGCCFTCKDFDFCMETTKQICSGQK